MTSLDAATGKTNWSFFTGDELYSSPSYADGKIYMMTSQRHIFVLNANNNGTKLAAYTTPSGSWSSPTIANGRLYIGNHDWNVYCFADTATKNPEPTPTPPVKIIIPPDYTIAIVVFVVIVVVAAAVVAVSLRRRHKKTV